MKIVSINSCSFHKARVLTVRPLYTHSHTTEKTVFLLRLVLREVRERLLQQLRIVIRVKK